jgi:hypothetical protein
VSFRRSNSAVDVEQGDSAWIKFEIGHDALFAAKEEGRSKLKVGPPQFTVHRTSDRDSYRILKPAPRNNRRDTARSARLFGRLRKRVVPPVRPDRFGTNGQWLAALLVVVSCPGGKNPERRNARQRSVDPIKRAVSRTYRAFTAAGSRRPSSSQSFSTEWAPGGCPYRWRNFRAK